MIQRIQNVFGRTLRKRFSNTSLKVSRYTDVDDVHIGAEGGTIIDVAGRHACSSTGASLIIARAERTAAD